MAGIYLHIPYCKQACVYCNFHFSTQQKNKGAMLLALSREAELRQDFLGQQPINSIYFGGGTPSLLSAQEITTLVQKMKALFKVSATAEITLEANPDDLNPAYLEALAQSPVNRLSIGIQSFREVDLKFMKRAHSAKESVVCIQQAQQAGFTNLTVDLIYGLPNYSVSAWRDALIRVSEMGIPHFAAYALTVEPKTVLNHQIAQGQRPPLDENLAAQHFKAAQDFGLEYGYQHYELSNFAKPGSYAYHNAGYWQGVTYLGLGPGAHSHTAGMRCWNVANNSKYLAALQKEELPLESEKLSLADQYNEFLMTNLRLKEGVDLTDLEKRFGSELANYALKSAKSLLAQGRLVLNQNQLYIPPHQRFYSDGLAADLFKV